MSDDLCRNNSRSHTPPDPINESVTPMCRTLQLTDVGGQQFACCDPREAVFQVGFPQPESPFKQNATTPQQARKLLSVKSSRGVENVLQAPDTQPLSPRRSVAPRTVRTTTLEQLLSLLYMSLFGQTLFYNSAFNLFKVRLSVLVYSSSSP